MSRISRNELLEKPKSFEEKKYMEWDSNLWRTENKKKKTLEIYHEFKLEIKQESYYNENRSLIRFKLRTNTRARVEKVLTSDSE